MADPITNTVDSVENAGRGAWGNIKSGFNTAVKVGKYALMAGTLVAGVSFAMQPQLLAAVAGNLGTQAAADTLGGTVLQTMGNAATYIGTGVANSGPVWSGAWDLGSSAVGGVSDFITGTDFTPLDPA